MQATSFVPTEAHGDIVGDFDDDAGAVVWRPISLIGGGASSWKTVTAVNSTLLLLLLLRLNRVVVPWILDYLRRRRSSWVSRVPLDIARELRDRPHARLLCTGPCCLASYDGVADTSLPAERTDEDDVESRSGSASASSNEADSTGYLWIKGANENNNDRYGGDAGERERLLPVSVQRWVDFVREAACHVRGCSDRSTAAAAAAAAGSLEVDEYFKLRVLQEERHRGCSQAAGRLTVASRDVWRLFTLVSLLFYWGLLTTVLLTTFHFDTLEGCSFAFSLLASGVVSEWDVLLPLRDCVPAWMRTAASGASESSSLVNSPTIV